MILLQLVIMASYGYLLGISVSMGDGSPTVVRFGRITDLGVDEGVGAVIFAFGAALLWAAFWPNRVARDSKTSGRAYHWALPVDRRRHDLLRTAAGALWLVPLRLLLPLIAVLVATLFGHGDQLTRFPVLVWVAFLLGPQLVYLLTSIPSLMAGKRQLLWPGLALGALGALFGMLGVVGEHHLFREAFVGPFGLLRAIAGPFFEVPSSDGGLIAELAREPWLPAFLVWLTLALVGVLVAASDRGRQNG